MKRLTKFVALGAVLAASSSLAFATPITGSIAVSEQAGGTTHFDATQISFNPDSGLVTEAFGTLGTFMNDTVTLSDLTFSAASGVTLLSFSDLAGDSFSYVTSSATENFYNTASLNVSGTGTFYETAGGVTYTPTSGTFILTASDGGATNFEITGTAAAATPEPNSLVLLGTGLIGAAGLLFMRRRQAAGLI